MQQDHPTSTQASLHLLIIGGGLGGLCLAQGLKHAGISVAVYERDPSVQFRSQSYRIGLNTDGGRALRSCLPVLPFEMVENSLSPFQAHFGLVFCQWRVRTGISAWREAHSDFF